VGRWGRICRISIPSGAIKSILFWPYKKRKNVISIPSGAIKSWRLILCQTARRISIPSGAIKSKNPHIGEIFFHEFQFLLVRLRDGKTYAIIEYYPTFQFLLVRLRALYKRVQRGGKIISIPSGAIKSWWINGLEVIYIIISIPSGAIKRRLSDFRFIITLRNFNSFWCD